MRKSVINNFRTKKIPPLVWRECTPRAFASRHIKKVWAVDLLLCSHCGGLMKVVSFIYEHRVIKKILAHLGLLREEEQKRGPPAHPKKCSEYDKATEAASLKLRQSRRRHCSVP